MVNSSLSLVSHLLSGMQKDCLSLYQDEYRAVNTFFDTLNFLSANADGCLEMSLCGKAFELAIITNQPLRLPVSVFNKKRAGTALPELGFFLWSRVFHVATGQPLLSYRAGQRLFETYEREELSTEPSFTNRLSSDELNSYGLAVWFLRQTLLIHSKRTDLPTIAVEQEEVDGFVERIQSKPEITLPNYVLRSAREYLRRILLCEDQERLAAPIEQWLSNPFGRHGPGAVYSGEVGKEKWEFCDSYTAWITHPEFIEPTTEKSISKCRLSVVPKDFRKHRLICIEQKEMMFYQQGLRAVVEYLVHSNPLSAQSICYYDQSRNYKLSKRLDNATIDLRDASDLVSRRLCKMLFPKEIYKLLVNGRSARVELPSGDSVAYESMYTMGNALCFTIETLVFAALVAASISCYSGKSLDKCARLFSVFGDDIIVKTEYFEYVSHILQRAGLSLNTGKSCFNTLIRESCGSWFVGGLDARIFRPATMQIVSDIDWISWFQVIRNLADMGLLTTAANLSALLSEYHPVPIGYFGIPGDRNYIKRYRSKNGVKYYRYNVQLQREEVLLPGYVPGRSSRLTGKKAIYAYFTGQGTQFLQGNKTTLQWTHLE